jgi:hypothetical protein
MARWLVGSRVGRACWSRVSGGLGATYDPASTTWSAPERINTNGPELCATNPSTGLDADRTSENDDDIVARMKSQERKLIGVRLHRRAPPATAPDSVEARGRRDSHQL